MKKKLLFFLMGLLAVAFFSLAFAGTLKDPVVRVIATGWTNPVNGDKAPLRQEMIAWLEETEAVINDAIDFNETLTAVDYERLLDGQKYWEKYYKNSTGEFEDGGVLNASESPIPARYNCATNGGRDYVAEWVKKAKKDVQDRIAANGNNNKGMFVSLEEVEVFKIWYDEIAGKYDAMEITETAEGTEFVTHAFVHTDLADVAFWAPVLKYAIDNYTVNKLPDGSTLQQSALVNSIAKSQTDLRNIYSRLVEEGTSLPKIGSEKNAPTAVGDIYGQAKGVSDYYKNSVMQFVELHPDVAVCIPGETEMNVNLYGKIVVALNPENNTGLYWSKVKNPNALRTQASAKLYSENFEKEFVVYDNVKEYLYGVAGETYEVLPYKAKALDLFADDFAEVEKVAVKSAIYANLETYNAHNDILKPWASYAADFEGVTYNRAKYENVARVIANAQLCVDYAYANGLRDYHSGSLQLYRKTDGTITTESQDNILISAANGEKAVVALDYFYYAKKNNNGTIAEAKIEKSPNKSTIDNYLEVILDLSDVKDQYYAYKQEGYITDFNTHYLAIQKFLQQGGKFTIYTDYNAVSENDESGISTKKGDDYCDIDQLNRSVIYNKLAALYAYWRNGIGEDTRARLKKAGADTESVDKWCDIYDALNTAKNFVEAKVTRQDRIDAQDKTLNVGDSKYLKILEILDEAEHDFTDTDYEKLFTLKSNIDATGAAATYIYAILTEKMNKVINESAVAYKNAQLDAIATRLTAQYAKDYETLFEVAWKYSEDENGEKIPTGTNPVKYQVEADYTKIVGYKNGDLTGIYQNEGNKGYKYAGGADARDRNNLTLIAKALKEFDDLYVEEPEFEDEPIDANVALLNDVLTKLNSNNTLAYETGNLKFTDDDKITLAQKVYSNLLSQGVRNILVTLKKYSLIDEKGYNDAQALLTANEDIKKIDDEFINKKNVQLPSAGSTELANWTKTLDAAVESVNKSETSYNTWVWDANEEKMAAAKVSGHSCTSITNDLNDAFAKYIAKKKADLEQILAAANWVKFFKHSYDLGAIASEMTYYDLFNDNHIDAAYKAAYSEQQDENSLEYLNDLIKAEILVYDADKNRNLLVGEYGRKFIAGPLAELQKAYNYADGDRLSAGTEYYVINGVTKAARKYVTYTDVAISGQLSTINVANGNAYIFAPDCDKTGRVTPPNFIAKRCFVKEKPLMEEDEDGNEIPVLDEDGQFVPDYSDSYCEYFATEFIYTDGKPCYFEQVAPATTVANGITFKAKENIAVDKLTLRKMFYDNDLHSFYTPISMSKENVSKLIKEKYTFHYMNSASELVNKDNTTLRINWRAKTDGSTLTGNKPYLVSYEGELAADGETKSMELTNVEILPNYVASKFVVGEAISSTTSAQVRLLGFCQNYEQDANNPYYNDMLIEVPDEDAAEEEIKTLKDLDKFYRLKAGNVWGNAVNPTSKEIYTLDAENNIVKYGDLYVPKFSAGQVVIRITPDEQTNSGYVIMNSFNDDEEEILTSIESIETENGKTVNGIYNLNGQKVQNMSKPGLYIVNGKKIMVK